MTVENILTDLREKMLQTERGLSPQPPDHQSNAHLTEPIYIEHPALRSD